MDHSWAKPVSLEGRFVRLEPLALSHAEELARACDDHMFDYFPVFPKELSTQGLEQYIEVRNAMSATLAFAVVDKQTGTAIGSTSFFDIEPAHKTLEIGHTWISRAFRGTYANPEMKMLMLQHAFEDLKVNRVQIRTDRRNLQSQNAILKLGATFEGAFRNHIVMPDGYLREAVFYSILPDEWPPIKESLLARLEL